MINGVSCSNAAAGAAPLTAAGGLNRNDRQQMLSSAADLLKMSVSDLQAKLAGGQSLDDIAQAQGVSHDDLVANIAASLKSSEGASGANQSDANLTAVANRIAGHHRHHGHHGAGPTSAVGATPATSSTDATGAVTAADPSTTVTGGSLFDVRA
ncbi:MAG TPA: hypothetical protein VFE55_06650 [Acidimicrobiia bacterium]|nr:hypothetical protein [Acidimicrobiia bacterium]